MFVQHFVMLTYFSLLKVSQIFCVFLFHNSVPKVTFVALYLRSIQCHTLRFYQSAQQILKKILIQMPLDTNCFIYNNSYIT